MEAEHGERKERLKSAEQQGKKNSRRNSSTLGVEQTSCVKNSLFAFTLLQVSCDYDSVFTLTTQRKRWKELQLEMKN